MMELGSLGQAHSGAQGISADGAVVVGWVGPAPMGGNSTAAFRWEFPRGMAALALPSLAEPRANAVSADGSTIVGGDGNFGAGFRWRPNLPTQALWGPGLSVSQDGAVVVGNFDSGMGFLLSYRWLQGAGTQDTSSLISNVTGVSASGDVIVGGGSTAKRYEFSSGTLTDLGNLGGFGFSMASGVSADGAVVVGAVTPPSQPNTVSHAFRWSAATGMQDLGTLGGSTSAAWAVSADGAVVVGESLDAAGNERAFRWTAASGLQDLGTLGGARAKAFGLSPDGSLIVGSSQNVGGAWRAFVHGADCDGNAVLDLYELRTAPGLDCNANGVLDTCDLAAGTSLDVNQNGRPDECDCLSGVAPTVFCAAKRNSQFCLPAIDISAAPSASNTGNCIVSATNVLTARNGVMFYGYQPASTPFQGGTLCVQGPIRRTAVQNSGAAGSSDPCAGRFAFDLNAYIASGADPLLQVVGQTFASQYWSRDPADPFGSSLTDAVQGQVCP